MEIHAAPFVRFVVSAASACAFSLLVAACMVDAGTEPDEESAPSISEPTLSPQLAPNCDTQYTHSCCLDTCTEDRYYCQESCRGVPQPDRGQCLNDCQGGYQPCLHLCDVIFRITPLQ
jgi:hypothetical protein